MATVKFLESIVGGKPRGEYENLPEIKGICVDSREVKPGDAFFAIPGTNFDGGDFVGDAIARGAVCAVTRKVKDGVDPSLLILVEDPVSALGKFSAAFFGDPSSTMIVVGITGTNGKTTITYLLESIMKHAGMPAGVIGTINYRFGDTILREGLTTPFPHELQEALALLKEMEGRYVFMEVSSHGISQRRVSEICFDAGIFTNLSRDHLDFHGDMESYFQAKKAFFTDVMPAERAGKISIVNIDCPYGRKLAEELKGQVITYGTGEKAHYSVSSCSYSIEGFYARVATPAGEVDIQSGLPGPHNLLNVLGAVAYAHQSGLDLHQIASGVLALDAVPGRLERVDAGKPIHLFVDYAHSPEGLRNVLASLLPHKRGKMIVVFGCGGDRDRGKRPLMGAVAGSMADITIVTSDNPRTEDPGAIMEEIIPGCERGGARCAKKDDHTAEKERVYLLEPDRKMAIHMAIEIARDGDIVLIAGKGHEPYQIVGKRKIDFDDRKIVRSLSGEKRSRGILSR